MEYKKVFKIQVIFKVQRLRFIILIIRSTAKLMGSINFRLNGNRGIALQYDIVCSIQRCIAVL